MTNTHDSSGSRAPEGEAGLGESSAVSREDLRRRLRWARDQGHPSYVWPDVPISEWRSALRELERIAGRVLANPGSADASRPDPSGQRESDLEPSAGPLLSLEVPPQASLRALGVAAFTSGLGPLVGHWLEQGRVRAPEAVEQLMAEHLEHARDRAVRMGEVLAVVADSFAREGLGGAVLKGGHTARTYFPETGTRPADDLDLVLFDEALPAAEAALEREGFALVEQQPHSRKSVWRPPGEGHHIRALDLTHRENPITVELHASLERSFLGVATVDFGDAEAASEAWPEGPGNLRVLRQPTLAAYLATHTSQGFPRIPLLRLAELVLVMRADLADGGLRWRRLDAHLGEHGARRFVYPAVELAERLVPGTVESAFLEGLRRAAPPRMRGVIDGLRPSDVQKLVGLSLSDHFIWADGPREFLGRALHVLLPSRKGASRRRLSAIYRDRACRLLHGRVEIARGRGDER